MININIDFLNTRVIIFNKIKQYKTYCTKENMEYIDIEENKNGGACINYIESKREVLIYFNKKQEQILIHELSHSVTFILDFFEIKDDEIRSYLLQFLFEEYKQRQRNK